jgi:nicotinamide-nucleotide amidase
LNKSLVSKKAEVSETQQSSAEILVVGNELLNGTTLDTNSHWISQELTALGVKVSRKTTIRDELQIISNSFKECLLRRPQWIFSVGGLGPTYDDMTIEGLAISLGKKLHTNRKAVTMLKESYERRRRLFNRPLSQMSRSSLKMAKMPIGATPLSNSVGSAPGVLIVFKQTTIVSFPGVPSEMKAIFSEEIVPLIEKGSTQFVNAEEWLLLIGASESRLAPIVSKISREYSGLLYVKSHPMGFENGKSIIHVQIILTTRKEDEEPSIIYLEKATELIIKEAKKLGATVRKLKSVR